MSITKAAIGLMYHLHESEYPREQTIANICSIGAALNMRSKKSDKCFIYKDFRANVEKNTNMMEYSLKALEEAPSSETDMEYNNLIYQVLACKMKDLAKRFGEWMGDEASILTSETERYKEEGEDNETDHVLYYMKGKEWKWEHTKSGQPLGPHGLWMTEAFAKNFAKKAHDHVMNMSLDQRQPVDYDWQGIGAGKFKYYWNGWWFSDRCAYAVGYVLQVIALCPGGSYIQLYEEDWDNQIDQNDERWQFINNVESYKVLCKAVKLKF